jgi:hypothetical protein
VSLQTYGVLLRRNGAAWLALVCALAWLALSGYTFAVILAVRAATGSFADAGGVVAVFSLAVAVLAPIRGRAIDTRGPRALAGFGLLHLLTGGVMVAAAAGASAAPVIATARTLWTEVAGPDLAHTGHALNAALSDAAVLLGPAIVAGLAAVLSPAIALAVVIGAICGSAWAVAALAARLRARQPIEPRRAAGGSSAGFWGPLRASAGLRTLVIAELPVGMWLGGLDIAVIAIAARHGSAELGAIPLVASAVGSLTASLASGTAKRQVLAARRYLIGSVIAVLTLPLALIHPSLATISATLVFTGVGFGLLNVAAYEILDDVVQADSQTEAFTWLTTTNAAGIAIGTAVVGRVTSTGTSTALLVVIVFALIAAATAAARQPTLR